MDIQLLVKSLSTLSYPRLYNTIAGCTQTSDVVLTVRSCAFVFGTALTPRTLGNPRNTTIQRLAFVLYVPL